MAAKKPKFNLDGLNSIMEGVATTHELPQTRPLPVESLWFAPQPRRLLGNVEAERLSNNDNFEEENEDWLVRVSDFLGELKKAAYEKPNEFAIYAATSARQNLHELEEMAKTIMEHGVLQPILVRELEDHERYVVTDGHRRVLATLLAGEDQIEAKIKKNWTTTEVLTEQLVANLQRKDFSALELTRAIVQLRALFEQELKSQQPRLHPNALTSLVWERLETTLGIGKRQLQRLTQLSGLDEKVLEMASNLPERRLRPLFKLKSEDQPTAVKLIAFNDAPTSVVEEIVQLRLNDVKFSQIVKNLGLKMPFNDQISGEVSRETSRAKEATVKSNSAEALSNTNEEDENTRVNGVLPALKRLPRDPEPLFRRLEAELSTISERERRRRLTQMEQIETQAHALAQRLAELRKRYK